MRVELDGRRIKSAADFHAEIARLLDFGPYYGKNLDALWDRVSFDVERPVQLVWTHATVSEKAMGRELFEQFKAILLRAEHEDRRRGETDLFEIVFRD